MKTDASFETLPDEMLLEICRYLHSGDVLYSFFGLNMRLNHTIAFYRHHVSLHRTTYNQFLHIFNFILPQISHCIRSLVIYELESPLFLLAFQKNELCRNLEKLKLVNWTDVKLMLFVDTLHNMERFQELTVQALDLTDNVNHRCLFQKLLGVNDGRLQRVAFDHECDALRLSDGDKSNDKCLPNIHQLDVELQTTNDLLCLCELTPNVEQLRVTFKRPWPDVVDDPPRFHHLRQLNVYAMSWFSSAQDLKALLSVSSVLEIVSFVLVTHDEILINGQRVLALLPPSIKQFNYSICFQPANIIGTFDVSHILHSWSSVPIAYSICPHDRRIFLHTVPYRPNRLALRSLFQQGMLTPTDGQIYRNARHVHVYDTNVLAEIFGIVQHCRRVLDLIVSMPASPTINPDTSKAPVVLPLLDRLDFLSLQGNPRDRHLLEQILSVASNLSALSIDFDCLQELLLDENQSLLLYYLLSRRVVILCIRFESSLIHLLTAEHIHCVSRVFSHVNHICFDMRGSRIPIDSETISLVLNHFPHVIVLSLYGRIPADISGNHELLRQQLVEQSAGRLSHATDFHLDFGNERVKVWL